MTDEGSNPMDAIELLNAVRNIASAARAFYEQAVAEGFTKDEALKLTMRWIHGVSGGKAE